MSHRNIHFLFSNFFSEIDLNSIARPAIQETTPSTIENVLKNAKNILEVKIFVLMFFLFKR